jgi:serine/threonine protein phosphatase PrpC
MGVTARWRSAVATDPGLVRETNEDRCFTDDERGVFLVVDGIGGHAGGEIAAELAVDTIRLALLDSRSQAHKGDASWRVRSAIVEANNVIHKTADANSAWHGMSCVLTLALVEDHRVTVGHVGDSRLYLIWNGAIRKLTSDQSPVGEQEEAGVLSESQAMRHPRRNEVFVDVGSRPRHIQDDFIQIRELEFKPDAALLLCSDGLSDLLTASEILSIVESYDGRPESVPQALIDAALEAGGRDNVSAVFVAGSDFLGSRSIKMSAARQRLSITRARGAPESVPGRRVRTPLLLAFLCLIIGFATGYAAATIAPLINFPSPSKPPTTVDVPTRGPSTPASDAHAH